MINLEQLAAMSSTELSGMFVKPESTPADMNGGEWLAVVQLLTARLTEEGESLSSEELNLGATALDVALRNAEQAGDIGRDESAIRRLNLMSALLRMRGQNPGVVLLSPERMYDLFSETVPLSPAEVQELPSDWRTLDITTIRRLRLVKNLVTPLLGVKPILEQAGLADDLSAWEQVMSRLP